VKWWKDVRDWAQNSWCACGPHKDNALAKALELANAGPLQSPELAKSRASPTPLHRQRAAARDRLDFYNTTRTLKRRDERLRQISFNRFQTPEVRKNKQGGTRFHFSGYNSTAAPVQDEETERVYNLRFKSYLCNRASSSSTSSSTSSKKIQEKSFHVDLTGSDKENEDPQQLAQDPFLLEPFHPDNPNTRDDLTPDPRGFSPSYSDCSPPRSKLRLERDQSDN